MRLRCYCCGDAIGGTFAIVSLSEETDRVFVVEPLHVERIEDAFVLIVTETGPDSALNGNRQGPDPGQDT